MTEDNKHPIRSIHFATPAEERGALVEELKRMYYDWVGAAEELSK